MALGTRSDFKAAAAAAAASRAVSTQCPLGREGCSASQLGASLPGHAPPTAPRAAGEQLSPSEHPSAEHRGGDNPAKPSKSGFGSPGWWHFCPKIQRR